MKRLRPVSAALVAAALTLPALASAASAWPDRPINMTVSTAAGSAPDIIARLVGNELAQMWGQAVVVHNRPGAGGNIGAQAAARAEPDGYNLWFAHATPVVMNQFLFKTPGFDTARDFVPIVRVGVNPMMVSVNPDTPFTTIETLLQKPAGDARRLSFATSGSKNIPHLVGETLNQLTGAAMVHVPYKGSQQAAADTIAGRTEVYIDAVPPMAPLIRDPARLRALAVTAEQRLPGFEQVPTLKEQGVDLVMQGWLGILAPAGTPDAVVQQVAADVNVVLNKPEIAARLYTLGTFDLGGTPAQFQRFIDDELQQWGAIVQAAGIERE